MGASSWITAWDRYYFWLPLFLAALITSPPPMDGCDETPAGGNQSHARLF